LARNRLALGLLALLLAGEACAADWSAWQRAYDPATGRRFIPVELWTGAEWDGTQAIRMSPATLAFGGHKSLSGPIDWLPPGAATPIPVYERLNGGKRQLFALRDDATGLGRVLDSRYSSYDCFGEVKFPLGFWKQGEVRDYQVACRGGKQMRPLRVTIEAIDFTYRGTPHSLRFHWLYNEGRGRGTDMRYVYSPLQGLVHVEGNE
jgi:hypothetical protein